MTTKNSVTGDTIATRPYSDKYGEGHDRICGKKENPNDFGDIMLEISNKSPGMGLVDPDCKWEKYGAKLALHKENEMDGLAESLRLAGCAQIQNMLKPLTKQSYGDGLRNVATDPDFIRRQNEAWAQIHAAALRRLAIERLYLENGITRPFDDIQ